jgi:hypothetical protein
MSWYDFAVTIEKEIKLLPPPSYLIFQLGSNDFGKGKLCGLIIDIKRDIGRIRILLPNTRIIWNEVLMRRYWHVAKGDGKIIERIRKRVICAVYNVIKNEGHYIIKHPGGERYQVSVHRLTHMAGTGKKGGPDPFRYSTSDHITAYFPAFPLEAWSRPSHVTMSGRF